MSEVEKKLEARGVFLGAHGLEGFANASEFWDKQPYGKRLYYGDGNFDYLHLDVLNAAIALLATPSETGAPQPRQEAQSAAGAPIAAHHKAHGLTPEMIQAHYPQSQHQPDECEMCDAIHQIAKEALARPAPPASEVPAKDALKWAVETFGDIALDRTERVSRFIEEAIELAHSLGLPAELIESILIRCYRRPRGLPTLEFGQAMLTLALLAEVVNAPLYTLAAQEFERIQSIPKAEWERRHKEKVELGIASASAAPQPPAADMTKEGA